MANRTIWVLWLLEVSGLLHLYASPRTPFDLPAVLQSALSDFHPRPEVQVSVVESLQALDPDPSALVLDYTYSSEMTSVLQEKAGTVLSLWPEVSVGRNYTRYATIFAEYLQALNMTRVRLISDTRDYHLRSCRYLISHFPAVFEGQLLQVPVELTEDFALEIAGRLVKPSGATVFALFTDREVAACFLSAFQAKRLNKAGYAFIVSEEASYLTASVREKVPLARHGLLVVASKESWMATSREEAEAKVLAGILAQLRDLAGLEATFTLPLPSFYLVNLQSSQPTLVAVRPSDVSTKTRIVFPGNTTALPVSTKVSIPVSINSVWLNSDGSIYAPSPMVMRGGPLAFENTNNRSDILPNFHITWKSVSLSGFRFNYSFTQSQVVRYSKDLGLLHMPPSLGVNAIQTSFILRDLNMSVPMAIGTRGDLLASPKNFPFYLRTRTGNHYCANVVAQVFKFFKWKRLAVLYTQDKDDNEELYRDFLLYAAPLGLNITNDEDKRILVPGLATDEQKAKLNASLTHIMQSDVRILMIISNDVTIIWEHMYDLGIRNEYLIIASTGLSYSMINGNNDKGAHKRRVVTNGALQFFPRTFVGKEGERVRQLMIARDGKNYMVNGCSYFDCGMLYLHATDYMLTSGIDYENTTEIMTAMRGTHFVGCAGVIRIGLNSNERSEEQYSLMNVIYFESNDSIIVQDAAYYNPFSATLLKIVNPFHWPDNSTDLYLDTLNSTFDCPFPPSQVQDFVPGVAIGFSVCFAICVLTGGMTLVIWKMWWNKEYPMLVIKQEMSADDVMQLAGVPLEFFQYASVGPDPAQLSGLIGALSSSTALELWELYNIKGNFYWTLLRVVLAVLGIYLLLCVLKFTKLEKKLEWLPSWSFVMLFTNLALPVISTLLFLPIISTLSHIFLCYHSTGSDFTSSYLNKDCYESCWRFNHILYVVGCSVALVIYIPLGVYTRPLWQELQPMLHIRSQPLPLMVKSLVQVLLITLNHTLKLNYSQVQGACFLAVMTAYFVFLLRFPQYNYHR